MTACRLHTRQRADYIRQRADYSFSFDSSMMYVRALYE